MSTNWQYIPFIGLPVELKTVGADLIPRDASTPGVQGPPRAHKLKTFFGLVSPDTAANVNDGSILATVRAPRKVTQAQIDNTDGSEGVNDLVPITTFVPGTNGATAQARVINVTFHADSDLVDIEIEIVAAAVFTQLGVCIDFSHSIGN